MILVLEDMECRIDWLRDATKGHVVQWCKTVSALVAAQGTPSLVILDHDLGDLGTANFSVGADGMTGLDAADCMPAVACPVLVWSMNPTRAPQMVQALQRRGMRATWAPYGTERCAATIALALVAGRGIAARGHE